MYRDDEDIIQSNSDNSSADYNQPFVESLIMENQVSVDEHNEAHDSDAIKMYEEVIQSTVEKEETKGEEIEQVHVIVKEQDENTNSHANSYYSEVVQPKNNKKKTSFRRFIAACVVVSLFGGMGIGVSYSAMQNLVFNKNSDFVNNKDGLQSDIDSATNDNTTQQTSNGQSLAKTRDSMTAVDVIDKVFPSVVNINMNVSGTANYYGFQIPYEGSGSGSGVIFSVDDEFVYIVTNNHVVSDATDISISVTGTESIKAAVIGSEASADIAVIKASVADFREAGINDIVVAEFGDSDNLKVGESVIAIGNALGEGKSATGGMISILNKNIEIDGLGLEVIQTSSPINEGNSGGALVNYAGEVIGINTAKSNVSTAEAMGYAIPSNTAKEIMNKLLLEGTTPKPYIGIIGSNITEDVSSMYKLPIGVFIRQVYDGSGAQQAGLQEGDIIISFAGKTIMSMESLLEVLKEQKIGSNVEIGIIRNADTPMTLNINILDANNLS